MERSLVVQTPIGPLTVTACGQAVTRIVFGDARITAHAPDGSAAGRPGRASAFAGRFVSSFSAAPLSPVSLSGIVAAAADGYATGAASGGFVASGGAAADIPSSGSSEPATPVSGHCGSGAFCTLEEAPPLLLRAARELEEYFAGTRRIFTLPLAPAGTPFQRRVWDALCDIPYGETRSYGAVARAAAGDSRACRAVGMANNRTPIVIVIPCHRVIGANGSLTGYAGGLERKSFLLGLEQEGRNPESGSIVSVGGSCNG